MLFKAVGSSRSEKLRDGIYPRCEHSFLRKKFCDFKLKNSRSGLYLNDIYDKMMGVIESEGRRICPKLV
jgi:hypothetical protein